TLRRSGTASGDCGQNVGRRDSPTANPGTKKSPHLHKQAGGPLAVAEGFEPSVGGYPTLDFEASTFSRSDTPPRKNLSDCAPGGQIAMSRRFRPAKRATAPAMARS